MNKGFLADKDGNIKEAWVWVNDSPCPFPNTSNMTAGDVAYQDDETPYDVFNDDFLTKISTRQLNKASEVVSKSSGRKVLQGKVKLFSNN